MQKSSFTPFKMFYDILTRKYFNPSQPSVAFHIEASHLSYTANEMTSFYMKCKSRMK